ncbi:MAG: VWA domain-containing protein, partial [Acidocella sp.]|nr:VWA domain-containing protein [Acidocella sp.]
MLAQNVMHFARLLRRAGMGVGVPESLAGIQALTMVNVAARGEVKAALRAVMVHRFEDLFLFDQAFELFWRLQEGNAATSGDDAAPQPDAPPPGTKRLAEAMADQSRAPPPGEEQDFKLDAAETFNAREWLQAMDFEAMGADEIARAKQEIKSLRLPLDELRTRRWRADAQGPRIDLAATITGSLSTGGEITRIARQRRITRPPPLVVLCDISGSMARYAQIMLHFLHSVANDRDRVSVFLFGTRLSNITRQLKHRDPELAFAMVSAMVPDWSGGTRIGEALGAFNQLWARRVLGQNAMVLLVT